MNSLHEGKLKDGRHMATRSEYVFSSYAGYYQQQLEESKEYQDFLTRELSKQGIHIQCFSSRKYQWEIGESNNRIEIKYDREYATYGNLYIETHEKSDPKNLNYVLSGINRDGVLHWIQGDYGIAFMFSRKGLCKYIDENKHRLRHKENSFKTSWGYILPKFDADRACIAKFRFNDKQLSEVVITRPEIADSLLYPPSERPRSELNLNLFGVTA